MNEGKRIDFKEHLKKFKKKNFDNFWNEWGKPLLIAGILTVLLRTFVIQPFKIPTNSMYETLKPRDRIFVSKFIYGAKVPFTDIRVAKIRSPRLGDIVVFTSPVEKKKYLIKRFIAGGGKNVQLEEGRLFVDGKAVESSPFKKLFYYNRGRYGAEGEIIKVPEGYFYVLGDNSANSMDSRYWGFVPDENLVGKAIFRFWPPKRIGIMKEGE
ncbi:MAG: signal peptidase I [Candidatus Omnitrophica bacterium]|nr:signal peptidase I [Candidatus Omnitrophota bacterium]